MYVAVVNQSKALVGKDALVTAMAAAWTRQLQEHVGPLWGYSPVQFLVMPKPAKGIRQLLIVDDPDVAGALGYHDVDPHGIPYGRVFVAPILDNGGTVSESDNSVSATGSHEAIEMYGDWGANLWADDGTGKQYALELCDAVEMSSYPIMVGHTPISLSNFLTPSWFRAVPEDHHFDYMKKLTAPFTMDAGGYVLYRDAGDVQSAEAKKFELTPKVVYGEKYPEWKKAMKAHPSSRTARRIAGYKDAAPEGLQATPLAPSK